jgi:hypothetical protein
MARAPGALKKYKKSGLNSCVVNILEKTRGCIEENRYCKGAPGRSTQVTRIFTWKGMEPMSGVEPLTY